jgi:hypothetical protein
MGTDTFTQNSGDGKENTVVSTTKESPVLDESNKKPRKPAKQLLFDIFCRHMNHEAGGAAVFGDNKFPHKFYVHEMDPGSGIKVILEEFNTKEVRIIPDKAVTDAIMKFTRTLDDGFSFYKFLPKECDELRRYWMGTTLLFPHKIKPVLQKSSKGYTWKRLEFDMKEMETPAFDDFLEHIQTNRDGCMAFIGMLFDSSAPRQQYLWLQGHGGDGKGSLMRLLRKILGNSYVVLSGDTRHMNQFYTSRLIGKKLGVFQDCQNAHIIKSELFMQLSGDDPVWVENKGKDGFTVDLDAHYIFLSNFLPKITNSPAHKRRAIICKMAKHTGYKFQHHEFEHMLEAESPGILYKCTQMWQEHKEKYARILVDTEVTDEIADENESHFEDTFNEFFEYTGNQKDYTKKSTIVNILRKQLGFTHDQISDMATKYLVNRYNLTPKREGSRGKNGSHVFKGVKHIKGIHGVAPIESEESEERSF